MHAYSIEEMKLLGFIFSELPNCNAQVSYLIRKANKRKYLLLGYSNYMPGNDLIKLYCCLVISIPEYSAVTLASQISKYQSNRLENVQKQCLRIMYGYGRPYAELLRLSGLERLSDRRMAQFHNFAVNAAKNPVYKKWFPLNEEREGTRNRKMYKEKNSSD